MADAGVKTTDLTAASLLDEVMGNRDGTTVRAPVAALATQMLGAGPLAAELDTVRAMITSGMIGRDTWTALLATTSTIEGQGGEVLDADAGTHLQASATGYNGVSVANAGRYSWNQTWGRWVRIGATGLSSKAPLASPVFTGTVTGITAAMVGRPPSQRVSRSWVGSSATAMMPPQTWPTRALVA